MITFLKLNNKKYLSLIDVGYEFHNLKLDDRSSYLTTFACLFGRYRYKRLPFGAVPAGDMFQHKTDEIFKDLPNVFGIMDDILVTGKSNSIRVWAAKPSHAVFQPSKMRHYTNNI